MSALPQPMVSDDRYVVLTSHQWREYGAAQRRPLPFLGLYVTCFSESFGRHVIIQDTLGM